jgi:hypothetical protein
MNFETFDAEYFKLKHPFTCMVVGPTKSGKSYFTFELLKNIKEILSPPPQEIYFVFSEWQPLYNEMIKVLPEMKMVEGEVNLTELKKDTNVPKLLILDDMMSEMAADKKNSLNTLFTKGSHHWNLSIIFIVQNLFFGGIRNSRLNSHYVFLFKSPDKSQINHFARQLYPGNNKIMLSAYNDAVTSKKYNPLLVDMTADIDERLRLRSNILPGDQMVAYIPKRL